MSFWQSFWDIIWWFVLVFAFVAYLWAVIAIISDLFRDHTLNGWWKALWIIFLVFVPFLTVLVYLIARGSGMAERAQKQALAAQDAADSYIRNVAGSSTADEIAKAKALLDAGTITPNEFESIKSKVLTA